MANEAGVDGIDDNDDDDDGDNGSGGDDDDLHLSGRKLFCSTIEFLKIYFGTRTTRVSGGMCAWPQRSCPHFTPLAPPTTRGELINFKRLSHEFQKSATNRQQKETSQRLIAECQSSDDDVDPTADNASIPLTRPSRHLNSATRPPPHCP